MAKTNQLFQRAADLIEMGGLCQGAKFKVGIDTFDDAIKAITYAAKHHKSIQCSLVGTLAIAGLELSAGPRVMAVSTEYLQERLGVDDLQAWSDLQDASLSTVINALRRAANWWPIKTRRPHSLADSTL